MPAYELPIERIVNVYHTRTESWARPRPMAREQCGLVCFVSGSITYFFDEGEEVTARPGDVLILPQGARYSGVKRTDAHEFCVIDFTTSPPDALTRWELPRTLPAGERVLPLFEQCLAHWQSGSLSSDLLCRAALYTILAQLLSIQTQKSQSSVQLERMLAYLREHYTEPDCSVQHLSDAFHLSASQVRRVFQKELGTPPHQALLSLRLELAKNLLRHEDLPIREVARRCGFSSEFYFSRLFAEKTGLPPSAFR